MKRRYVIFMVAGLCLVTIVVLWLWPTPGITRENLERIKGGMTEEQVNAIFGRSGDGSDIGAPESMLLGLPVQGTVKIWYADDGNARVQFDRNGKVVAKAWLDVPRSLPVRGWVSKFWNRIKEWWSPSVMPSTMPMTMPVRRVSTAPSNP
jgi:hypothetical protein